MAYNKIVYKGETLIDLTDLDVAEEDVAQGKTFIKSNGVKSTGTSTGGGSTGKFAEYVDGNLTEVSGADLNGISKIRDHAFGYCNKLTSVEIPDSVTSIGYGAFEGCTGLTSVEIPNSVTSIGTGAFDNCSGLTSVYITDIAKWCGINFDNHLANPLYYAHNLYLNGQLVTDLVIPDSVTSIGDRAFYNCSGLTSVTIGNSVTSIGYLAFEGCSGLTSITIPDSVTSIDDNAFYGCTKLTDVYYYGNQSSWNSIRIDSGNMELTKATIHFIGKTESYNNVETRTESNSTGTTLYITTNS